jgi:hypothetical protein
MYFEVLMQFLDGESKGDKKLNENPEPLMAKFKSMKKDLNFPRKPQPGKERLKSLPSSCKKFRKVGRMPGHQPSETQAKIFSVSSNRNM